ncbi:MAG: molybdopterin-dependent oxidoreductase [Chloroflexi bacterium]|uniref:Molybdopterin-dependent oxidoreductase n=1 Tax=Candidatus Chlorohelix allophototropha TaxID=3003348 RepID=A0A8T7M7Q5_9CHLR|nr:molybdopterin-dependent oxidoreductase [Chloroflexota bacterium]WJW67984.1 molybdopterin-dependent oxidoreductase [Chloroflexota bacterium L227-S17]
MADATQGVQLVKVTIDNVEVSVPKGTFAIEAAKRAGIYISNMCAHPDVRPFGSCRMCTVGTVSKWGFDFEISCALECKDGMVIFTENSNDQVREVKQFILESLLIDHPLDCPICPSSGACDLQNATWHYGISENRLARPKDWYEVDYLSPAIVIKRDRCVNCGQCVRVCEELVGAKALCFANRGIESYIDSAWGGDLTTTTPCTSCGMCVEVCPVGCLMHVQFENTFLNWNLKRTPTTCNYCSTGCQVNLEAEVNTGLIEKITFNEAAGVGDGRSCVKGRYGHQYINSKDRLTSPLMRKGEEFVEISWDQAYNEILNRLNKYKGDQFAAIASGKLTNEENYLLQKFTRGVMNSNNIDNSIRFNHGASINALLSQFGMFGMTNTVHDVKDYSGCMLIAGSDLENTAPVISYHWQEAVQRRKALKVIVVDPRPSRWTERAHLWLQIKPGTDAALFNGLAYIIFKENLLNTDFISARTTDFEAWKSSLSEYTPEKVSAITGVPAAKLLEAARLYATGGAGKGNTGKDGKYPASAIVYGTGITQWTNGVENVHTLANLTLLTGNLGRQGGGLNGILDQANDQGAADMGCLPDFLPGYVPVTNNEGRAVLETLWFGQANEAIPAKPGLKFMDIFKAAEAGQVKALYIVGENPLVTAPNLQLIQRALEKVELLIVQDLFMSETAKFADFILPAAGHAEKDGTYTSTERRVSRVRKALSAPGIAKPDWKILTELLNRPGFANNYKSAADILEEIARTNRLYQGVTLQKLERSRTISTFKPGLLFPGADYSRKYPYALTRFGPQTPVSTEGVAEDGTPILFKDKFATASGKARFVVARYNASKTTVSRDYPLILSVGRASYANDRSGVMLRRNYVPEALDPEPELEINEVEAKKLNIESGDIVKVASAYGAIEIKAKVTDTQPRGYVFMPWMFREAPGFVVTSRATDERSGSPELKNTAVSVQFVRKSLAGLLQTAEGLQVVPSRS